MKKIGLYFGSFNPIHNAHNNIVKHLLDNNIVDEIELIVSPQNPLKSVVYDFDKRCDMCDLVFQGHDNVHVNRIESTIPTPSYTIDTLKDLEKINTFGNLYYIIMGLDNWENITKWKSYKEILENYPILILPRYYDDKQIKDVVLDTYNNTVSKLIDEEITIHKDTQIVLNSPVSNLSASFIRNKIKNNKDIIYYVDEKVNDYIIKNHLYK